MLGGYVGDAGSVPEAAAGSPGSVDVLGGVEWEVVVDNVVDQGDVQSPGEHVRGEHDAGHPILKFIKACFPQMLSHKGMYNRSFELQNLEQLIKFISLLALFEKYNDPRTPSFI